MPISIHKSTIDKLSIYSTSIKEWVFLGGTIEPTDCSWNRSNT